MDEDCNIMMYISSYFPFTSSVFQHPPSLYTVLDPTTVESKPTSINNNTNTKRKMHLILTGATGLVGSAVLDAMIKTKDITKISIISRRPVKMVEDAKDHRINVILHKDFEKYDSELLN